MTKYSVLFLTYWYPNKNSKSLGIFSKRHAQAISINHNIVVLSLVISKGGSMYKKKSEIFRDENNIDTHQIFLESYFYKLLYVLLPFHYIILHSYILKNLSNHNFNIVHSNVIFPCGIVGNAISNKLRVKHVITEHWTKIDKFFKVSLYRFSGKKALDQAEQLTFVSKQLAATVKKYTNNANVNIIPNVIDSKEFYFNRAIVKNKTFTFIAAAHWAQFKNPFYFLDALKLIADEKLISNFKVVMAGNGEQIDRVKSNNYPFSIELKGNLNPFELKSELNKSHIFLHGSDFETFSVIIAEALMCGLPSVVSPYGIALEAINASNGFVTNNTVEDWKDKILKCYHSRYNNQEIASQLKHKYDLETVGRLFSDVYNNI